MNGVKPAPPDAESGALSAPVECPQRRADVLAVVAVVVMLQYAESMIIPIVLGVLISYALDPMVAALTRWHLPRPVGAAILLIDPRRHARRLALYQLAVSGKRPSSSSCRRARGVCVGCSNATGRRQRAPFSRCREPRLSCEKAAGRRSARRRRPAFSACSWRPPPINISELHDVGIPRTRRELSARSCWSCSWCIFLLASGDLYRRKIVKIAGPSLTKKKITLQIL